MTLANFVLVSLVVLVSVTGIYYFRLAMNYRAILREGAMRFNQQSEKMEGFHRDVEHLKKTQNAALEAERSAQKALKLAELRHVQLQQDLENLKATMAHKEKNFELQKNFLEKEIEKERDKTKERKPELLKNNITAGVLKDESVRGQTKNRAMHPLAVQQLKDRIELLQRDIYERDLRIREIDLRAKATQAEAQTKLAELNPDKIASVKRRAAHYERLYVSMKSYREMSEERLQNWEGALRKLSLWVLEKNPQSPATVRSEDSALEEILNQQTNPQGPLGPIVGLALEKIGTGFLDDPSA